MAEETFMEWETEGIKFKAITGSIDFSGGFITRRNDRGEILSRERQVQYTRLVYEEPKKNIWERIFG